MPRVAATSANEEAENNPFETLGKDFQWYTVANGKVQLARAVKTIPNRVVQDASRLAIALNQICFERRRGRVFVVQCYPESPPYDKKNPDQGKKSPEFFQAFNALRALPSLIYLPTLATDAEAAEWKSLTPCQQLHRSWAPHGWVHPDVAILPFSAFTGGHGLRATDRLELHGRFKFPVFVAVIDTILVGTSPDWIKILVHKSFQNEIKSPKKFKKSEGPKGPRKGIPWKEFFQALEKEIMDGLNDNLAVDTLGDVLDFLDTKYGAD